jgi:hypothetical protein
MINVLTHVLSNPGQREDSTLLWPDTDYDMQSYSYLEENLSPGESIKGIATPLLILRTTAPVALEITRTSLPVLSIEVISFFMLDTPMLGFTITRPSTSGSKGEAANITLFHQGLHP